MPALLWILLLLFAALALLLWLTERFSSPLSQTQQARLSRWLIPLVFCLLLAGLLRHFWPA